MSDKEFVINPIKNKIIVNVSTDDDGDLFLKINGCSILYITKDGELSLYRDYLESDDYQSLALTFQIDKDVMGASK